MFTHCKNDLTLPVLFPEMKLIESTRRDEENSRGKGAGMQRFAIVMQEERKIHRGRE